MNDLEKILRKKTMNLFNNSWYLETTKEIMGVSSEQKGYTYFIKTKDSNLIKIGMSINLTSRMKNLSTLSNNSIYLIGFIYGEKYKELEIMFHKKYSEYRERGEWFNLSKKSVIEDLEINNGLVVNKKLTKNSFFIDGEYFDNSKNLNSSDYYDLFFEICDKLPFNERILKFVFHDKIRGANNEYANLTKKKITMKLKEWCDFNNVNYIDINSNGSRYFLLKKN